MTVERETYVGIQQRPKEEPALAIRADLGGLKDCDARHNSSGMKDLSIFNAFSASVFDTRWQR